MAIMQYALCYITHFLLILFAVANLIIHYLLLQFRSQGICSEHINLVFNALVMSRIGLLRA